MSLDTCQVNSYQCFLLQIHGMNIIPHGSLWIMDQPSMTYIQQHLYKSRHYDGKALSFNPGLQYPHLHGPVHTPDNNRQNVLMNNEKKNFWLWAGWVALICRDLYQHRWMGGPDATSDLWKQPFSAVRASGGYPGNDIYMCYCSPLDPQNTCSISAQPSSPAPQNQLANPFGPHPTVTWLALGRLIMF